MLLGCIFKKPGTIIAAAAALAGAYAASTLPDNAARYLNILAPWDAGELYEGLVYLDVFGLPVSRLAAARALFAFRHIGRLFRRAGLFVRKRAGSRRRAAPEDAGRLRGAA